LNKIAYAAGSELVQKSTANQKWSMTTDGYLIYGAAAESALALSVENQAKGSYKLILSVHKYSEELRWGFLIPKFGYRSGVQILSHWSIHILREWRKTTTRAVAQVGNAVSVAEWPQGEFYIGGKDSYALVPEKSEAGAILVMKKLEVQYAAIFKWIFRNGYLVHCATGLVMQAQGIKIIVLKIA
jgi:hypothetical protein